MSRLAVVVVFSFAVACAHRPEVVPAITAVGEPRIEVLSPSGEVVSPGAPAPTGSTVIEASSVLPADGAAGTTVLAASAPELFLDSETREGALGEDDSVTDEDLAEDGESREVEDGASHPSGHRYTNDLSDDRLQQLWRASPEELGSMSLGFADEGRIINARQFPRGDAWRLVSPSLAWATAETIDYTIAAINRVKAQFPDAYPLRVNQISAPEGGYLRPHKSHQSGRDVDLGFYYRGSPDPIRVRERERVIDVEKNWALIRALAIETDVQVILLDRRVQRVIYEYALSTGEDQAWLDSLFNAGRRSLVQHARGHRDHYHVRFFNPRAQELGRRVTPLLAQRPEQNLAFHRVRRGDTLGHIARRYGTTVSMVQKANRMRGSFLRLSQILKIPLRKPCNQCPVPPAVVVPPRRLPPPAISAHRPTADAPVETAAR